MNKMKLARMALGYRLIDIAAKIGVPESTIWQIENQKVRADEKRLQKIAEILNLNPNEIFDEVNFIRCGVQQ